MTRLVMFSAVAAALCAACAEPDPGSTHQPIVNGTSSTEGAVVALIGHVGNNTYLCTGAVIAPRTILTAAHCVADRDAIDVIFGPDIEDEGSIVATIAATRWDAHPNWDNSSNDLFDHHDDVGLILLASDAPVSPLPMRRSALAAADVGASMRLVGYGNTINNGIESGVRLEATTTLASYDEFWTTAGDQNGTTCVGDSGGPQFITSGSSEVIVGVTSFGTAPPGQPLCQYETIAARVDRVVTDFIDPFIAQYDPPPGTPDAGAGPGADAGGSGGMGDDGGGCTAGGGSAGGGVLMLLLLAVMRRGRR